MSNQPITYEAEFINSRSLEDSSDRQLLLHCSLNDKKGQVLLFNTYKRFVLGICMRYTNSTEEAKDFSQESFIRIFDSLSKKPEINSLKGWIATITVRTVIDQVRKKKKLFLNGLDFQNSSIASVENTAIENLSAIDLIKLLQSMPEGYRVVFNLYIIEGYSHNEISDMLGISESASRSQLTRGKEWLRVKLKN